MVTMKKFSYQPRKLEELLLLVAELSADDPSFGKTKLNKILFYIDFFAYGHFGKPVTGATYQHRPYGPVPREIVSARDTLVDQGAVDLARQDRFGYAQERLTSLRSPDLSLFDQAELNLIRDVITALWTKNGVEASEASHREIGWRITSDGQAIPYEAVFVSNRAMTADDVRRGQEVHRTLAGATL